MNPALKTLGLISAGVIAGVVLTPAPDQPEPKVKHEVHVVKLPPKVVTKKIVDKEIKYKTNPQPESCESALDYIKLNINKSNDMHNTGVKFSRYVDSITIRRLSQSDTENKTVQWLADHQHELDSILLDILKVNYQAENAWDQCTEDLERQRDGDDVEPADSVHVTTP